MAYLLFHGGYAIYYRFTQVEIIITHVAHGARDAAALIADDEA